MPASYVAEYVELGYATTAFRSQGRTVDTAHVVVSPTTTREVLYVAATRGRESNRIYVDIEFDPDPATGHDGAVPRQTAREVLAGVLANEGAELSAHEALARAQLQADDFGTLVAEYEAIARVAQQERWDALLEQSGIGAVRAEQVRQSDAYGALTTALRRAEAHGLDVERNFPAIATGRLLFDADDLAAVLQHRVQAWINSSVPKGASPANFIAGRIPKALGVTDHDLARALAEREAAIERRALEVNEPAVHRHGASPPLARSAASVTPDSAMSLSM